jgi:hypothetical protein
MNKVSVVGTIRSAYAFMFGNLATIAGLIWLPMALLVAVQYYATARFLTTLVSAFADGNLYELNRANGLRYLSYFVALLLQAVLVTPVMRQALELRRGGAFVSFDFGTPSLRVFGATSAFAIVFFVIECLAAFAMFFLLLAIAGLVKAAGPAGGFTTNLVAGSAVLGLIVLALAALSYCAVRLSFLLVAVAIAERKIDLIRSWALFDRNFVRVSLVLLAIGLPLVLVHAAMLWAAFGFPLFRVPSPAFVAQFREAPTRILTGFVQFALGKMPLTFGIDFLLAPFWVGLSAGAAAAAYRDLVPATKNDMRGAAEIPVALEASPV